MRRIILNFGLKPIVSKSSLYPPFPHLLCLHLICNTFFLQTGLESKKLNFKKPPVIIITKPHIQKMSAQKHVMLMTDDEVDAEFERMSDIELTAYCYNEEVDAEIERQLAEYEFMEKANALHESFAVMGMYDKVMEELKTLYLNHLNK